jgi:hypothetical protein
LRHINRNSALYTRQSRQNKKARHTTVIFFGKLFNYAKITHTYLSAIYKKYPTIFEYILFLLSKNLDKSKTLPKLAAKNQILNKLSIQ